MSLNPLKYTLGELKKALAGAAAAAASSVGVAFSDGSFSGGDLGIVLGAALVGFLAVFGFKNEAPVSPPGAPPVVLSSVADDLVPPVEVAPES